MMRACGIGAGNDAHPGSWASSGAFHSHDGVPGGRQQAGLGRAFRLGGSRRSSRGVRTSPVQPNGSRTSGFSSLRERARRGVTMRAWEPPYRAGAVLSAASGGLFHHLGRMFRRPCRAGPRAGLTSAGAGAFSVRRGRGHDRPQAGFPGLLAFFGAGRRARPFCSFLRERGRRAAAGAAAFSSTTGRQELAPLPAWNDDV